MLLLFDTSFHIRPTKTKDVAIEPRAVFATAKAGPDTAWTTWACGYGTAYAAYSPFIFLFLKYQYNINMI